MMMMRLGPVVLVAVLQVPPVRIMNDNEVGAGFLGSSAPDTASDDEIHWGRCTWKQCSRFRQWLLGPIFLVAVLQIPPVTLDYDIIIGAGVCGSCAPDTTSNCWIK